MNTSMGTFFLAFLLMWFFHLGPVAFLCMVLCASIERWAIYYRSTPEYQARQAQKEALRGYGAGKFEG